jgi:hypothetical protein
MSYVDLPGVYISSAVATYGIDSKEPVLFSVGDDSLRDVSGVLLFETGPLPPGEHNLNVVYFGNNSTSPLAITYFVIQNEPSSLSNSSTTIHRKPIIGGIIRGLVLILVLLVNIWPSHVS